jgi:hypothetical protein
MAAISEAYVMPWRVRYAPPSSTAHSRLPSGMNGPEEKIQNPRVTRLIENAA